MTDITANTIALESAIERLRQERETFNHQLAQSDRWFILRLIMGYVAVILLPTVAAICGYMILNPTEYSSTSITAASGALFVDVLGLLGAVWKVVLNPESVSKISPVSSSKPIDKFVDNN
ncbi:hypothetical protein [Thalassotalea atypica]|uniref:hypothetical protein n=1 Tax=Thalassotalea atypica TaxID=2054316 RepID=UPI002572E0F7|nr:hypothetical protein [Thalassotalea atypica]